MLKILTKDAREILASFIAKNIRSIVLTAITAVLSGVVGYSLQLSSLPGRVAIVEAENISIKGELTAQSKLIQDLIIETKKDSSKIDTILLFVKK